MIFWKINEFQKSEGTGHAGTRNDAVLEAAKVDTSFRISIFEKNWTSSKKLRISQIWRYRPCGVPKWCRPGGGKNRHILQDFKISTFCMFVEKSLNFTNLKVPAMLGPEMMPSRRRQKSTHPSGFLFFFFAFSPPKYRPSQLHSGRFRTTHPSPEGLSGVRIP